MNNPLRKFAASSRRMLMPLAAAVGRAQSTCRKPRTRAVGFGASLAIVALTGCTAPSYQMAPKNAPPAIALNLLSTEPPFEVVLHSVIVFHGPGSWKRHAWWDEYIVTVANRGHGMLTIESATLTDFQDHTSDAGTDPWKIEATSRQLAERTYDVAADNAIVQVGGGVTGLAVGSGLGAVIFTGGYAGATGGAILGAWLALPVAVGGTVYANVKHHNAVEREFARRRLSLPITLPPGQLAHGSLFFRISPGPRRLALSCRVDNEPRTVVVDLAPLRALHFKSPAPGTKLPPAGSAEPLASRLGG